MDTSPAGTTASSDEGRPVRSRAPPEYFTSNDFNRRIRKARGVLPDPPTSEDEESSDESSDPESELSKDANKPTKESKQLEEAKLSRKINSKVSLRYNDRAASALAYEKILQEQLQDKTCIKITTAISSEETGGSMAEQLRLQQIKNRYFIHEKLLMRRFLPLQDSTDDNGKKGMQQESTPEGEAEPQPEEERFKPKGRNWRVKEKRLLLKRATAQRVARRNHALNRSGPIGRTVVPKALVRDVLNVFHGIPLTGHLGKDKTVHTISQHFYWAGLTKDVARRVKGCHLCQMRKQTRPMKSMFPGGFHASEPMELWVIDCVTHLPESDGNVLLLTCVDVFTKLVVAIPLPNEKSETVGRALQQRLFSVHGYPRLLLSDRAQGFVSDGLKWLSRHLGVVKINTTGLLPTGASPIERFHRGLGASLTMVCNKAKQHWAFLVDSVTFAYNISVNESTGTFLQALPPQCCIIVNENMFMKLKDACKMSCSIVDCILPGYSIGKYSFKRNEMNPYFDRLRNYPIGAIKLRMLANKSLQRAVTAMYLPRVAKYTDLKRKWNDIHQPDE